MRVTGQHVRLLSRVGCHRCGRGLDRERDVYRSRVGDGFVVCRGCHNKECREATDELDDEHRARYVKPWAFSGTVVVP